MYIAENKARCGKCLGEYPTLSAIAFIFSHLQAMVSIKGRYRVPSGLNARAPSMSKRGNAYGHNRVNILKKVRVGKNWNLYPAVVEPNG